MRKNLIRIATIVGLLITLIGAAFAESEMIAVPVSVMSVGLFITTISLIANNRMKGEQR